jgi:hypothetical protein
VIAMLQGRQGATIPAIMKATGWQQHSVRGFLAGVVRKRLGLTLVSDKTGDERVYRISDKPAPAKRKGKPRDVPRSCKFNGSAKAHGGRPFGQPSPQRWRTRRARDFSCSAHETDMSN